MNAKIKIILSEINSLRLCIFIFLLLNPLESYSFDTQVLPKGVRAFMWKHGYVGSVAEHYSNDSSLKSLDARMSQNFDSNAIQRLNPRAPELINALNTNFPSKYKLGDQIELGQLRLEGSAEVDFTAPVIAYGISNRWTIALALPFAKLNSNINVRQTGNNNVKQIYDAISKQGGINDELEEALTTLMNINLKKDFESLLIQNGYQPLQNESNWRLGDVQIVSKYQYYNSPSWTLLNQIVFNLPTGYSNDPSNLVDLPIFNRSFIEVSQVQDYRLSSKLTLGSSISYQFNIQDRVDRRVPENTYDFLPDASRQEKVKRKVGDTTKWQANIRYDLNSFISLSSAYIGQYKFSDSYRGSRGYDYSLLEINTQAVAHRAEYGLSYSSVNSYLNNKTKIPYSISYKYADLFKGRNVENQTAHELTLTVFF